MQSPATPIVDAQVHVWRSNRQVTPANVHHRHDESFTGDDLLVEMDKSGVDAAVLVPPSWSCNAYAFEVAARHLNRFGVMARLTSDDPPDLDDFRDRHPGLLGLRLVFNAETRSWLTSGEVDWLWQQAERADIPVMVLAPSLLGHVARIAGRHPGLRLAIDHLAVPRRAQGPVAFAHMPELLRLANLPNVSVKASGLPSTSLDRFPFRDLSEPLERVLEAFGPLRVFWGSDFSRMPCSYGECVEHLTEGCGWLEKPARHAVMGGSLCAWLGWSVTPASSTQAK